jgi:hypothetical protein
MKKASNIVTYVLIIVVILLSIELIRIKKNYKLNSKYNCENIQEQIDSLKSEIYYNKEQINFNQEILIKTNKNQNSILQTLIILNNYIFN